ncbi:MAG: hypothetical protein WB507_08725 [Solirubrobacterales bacterium]
MGLFNPTPVVDGELAKAIIAEEARSRRWTEKVLAKNQAGLPALLQEGEDVAAITHADGINELLVVTNQRLLRVKKGKMNWAPIALGEVAEASIGARDLGRGTVKYMLVVDTHTSKLYADGDQRRFHPDHFFSVDFDNPQDARALCAVIDLLAGQALS